jgi:hypothetical protein
MSYAIQVATLGEYAPESVAPDAVTYRRATLVLSAAFVTSAVACAALLDVRYCEQWHYLLY